MTNFRLATLAGAAISMAAALGASAQTDVPGGAINAHLGDKDYGVCRGVDPVCRVCARVDVAGRDGLAGSGGGLFRGSDIFRSSGCLANG